MARLESQSKLLYYPTPTAIADTIGTWFTGKQRTRVADPCCGTGEALVRFSAGFNAERIGIELSYSRAADAAKVLDAVLPTSFYTATWSVQSVGLMYNNPPYDWSEYGETVNGQTRRVRHEVMFVERARDKIVVGGHHVIIIPRYILGDVSVLGNGQQERMARHLLGWYEDVHVFRFPDGEYEAYKQVVVLACKRRAKYQTPTKDAIGSIVLLSDENVDIPILPEGDGQYVIPAVSGSYTFKFTPREPADVIRTVRASNPLESTEWDRATYVPAVGEQFNPVEPINQGHVTLLLSSGNVGVIKTEKDGLLIKGTSRKSVHRSVVTNYGSDGKAVDDVIETERFEPVWTVARPDGSIETISDIKEIAGMVGKYGKDLIDAVQQKNSPQYNNDPTREEWRTTGRVGLGMKPLPRRTERGLLDRQRHWAIALKRTMLNQQHAIANLGMGTGKTLITVATLASLNQFPAIVTCPAHMPAEWVKTVEKGSDEKDPIRPMWITRPVSNIGPGNIPAQVQHNGETLDFSRLVSPIFHPKYQPGWITEWNAGSVSKWGSFADEVNRIGGTISSNVRWHDEKDNVVRRWRKATIECTGPQASQIAGMVTRGMIVRLDGMVYGPQVKFRPTGLEITVFDSDEYTLFDFQADYRAGKLGRKAVAIVSIESAKYDAGDDQCLHIFTTHAVIEDDETGELRRITRHICSTCGQPVDASWRTCQRKVRQQKLVDPIYGENGKVVSYHLTALPDKSEDLPVCGAPLFQFSRNRRVGAARLAQKKMRGFFKVYAADELHKNKSIDTDSGVSDQRFISATRYSLGLTGTLFGGTASSLFPLLYRRVPAVRARFAFGDTSRWVDAYGVWETRWNEDHASVTGRGASTGLKRWGMRSRELPGISPAVILYLLPIAVFGQITDLGYELPPYEDVVEILDMSLEGASHYHKFSDLILREAMRLYTDGDGGGMLTWFNMCRFRPNSMFRPEVAEYNGKRGSFSIAMPAVPGWMPKEKRIAEIAAENTRRGRKTLVFVEQTGTRDIRPRMKNAIEEIGTPLAGSPLRVGVLSANDRSPNKRMAWITANAPSMDVLIVNPKLVETGLTLTMFSAIVFYEMTPSLYTAWQSMRRVWRLGQENSVETRYLAYRSTVEEDILQRMGSKMKAASILYGNSASSVLETSDSSISIEEEIIRAALSGSLDEERKAAPVAEHLFATGKERVVAVTTEISGSVVAASAELPVSVPMTLAEWATTKGVAGSARRKVKAAPAGQLPLGF